MPLLTSYDKWILTTQLIRPFLAKQKGEGSIIEKLKDMFIFLQLSTHCPHPPKGRIQGKRSQLCTVSRCTLGSTRTSPPAAHILNQSGSKSHKTRSTLWSLIEIFNPNFHRVSLPTINPYLPKPLQSLVKANSFRDRQTRSTDCRISMEWIRATGTWCTPQGRAVNEPRGHKKVCRFRDLAS